jgi:uncharacterized membrane protein (UPF0136 family)
MNYAKALVAFLVTLLSGIVAALTGDNHVDSTEWINVAIAATGALAVFTAPNVPGARVTKFVLAALTAVLTLAVNLIADGVTVSEWLQLLVAAAGAVGVYAVPNSNSRPHGVEG